MWKFELIKKTKESKTMLFSSCKTDLIQLYVNCCLFFYLIWVLWIHKCYDLMRLTMPVCPNAMVWVHVLNAIYAWVSGDTHKMPWRSNASNIL